MKRCLTTAFCMLACLPCVAADPPKNDVTFLSTNTAYAIEFAKLPSVFRGHPRSRTVELKTGSLRKVTATDLSRTDALKLFKITKLGPGTWVQLEYPASPADWPMWRSTLGMTSKLTQDTMKTLGTDESSRNYLNELKEASTKNLAKLKTRTIWVNLAHAVTIVPVDNDLSEISELLDRRANAAK